MEPSSVQGRAYTHPPTPEEGGSVPGRRPGKEPVDDEHPEVHEVMDDDDEGLGENIHAFPAGS